MENRLSDILTASWVNGVIVTAVRLKIFSVLADREMTSEAIASACGAVPDRLRRILDACVSLGLLHLEGGRYRNSHFSRVYFREGVRLYVGDFLKLVNDEAMQWFNLPDVVCGNEPTATPLPEDRFDHRTFIAAMHNIGCLGEAEALKDAVDLSGCRTMIDAGGGSGLYSIALCRRFPALHATIFDVKETLTVTQEIVADQVEKSRIALCEGDFLKDPLGENADVVLLSDVIYEDAAAKVVLKNAWKSLAPGGMLIIRGYYADPEETRSLFGALFAVKQLADDPQRKIMTVSKLKKNVREAGFDIVKADSLTAFSFILVGRRTSGPGFQ